VESAFVTAIVSTLSAQNAFDDVAQNILHIHTILQMSCFQPLQFNRGKLWVRQGAAGLFFIFYFFWWADQQVCLRYFANSCWLISDLYWGQRTLLHISGYESALNLLTFGLVNRNIIY
jgi:hypothetical protein